MRPDDLDRRPPSEEAWGETEHPDFDVSVITANLRLTPAERIRQHARALETAMLLRVAMEEKRARSRESP
jgi:hypothetical protein